MMNSQTIPLVENIPLVYLFFFFIISERIEQCLIIDKVEQIEYCIEWIFSFVAQQLGKLLIEKFGYGLPGSRDKYIRMNGSIFPRINLANHILQ